jgi:hypothetical protein
LHVLINSIHVIDVAHRWAAAVSCKMTWFSAVEAGSFGLRVVVFFLGLCSCCVCVLGGCHVCIYDVALVLLSIIGCPGPGQVHRDLYVIICWLRGIGGIVGGPLLLLGLPLLLVLLGACSLAMQLELTSVLSEGVVEGPWVWESSSGSDELYHLSSLGNFYHFGFIFCVSRGEWSPYNSV